MNFWEKIKQFFEDLSQSDNSADRQNELSAELLIFGIQLAALNITQEMKEKEGFAWLRSEHANIAYDDLNFIYKNQVFSVIIDIQDKNGKSYLDRGKIQRQLTASKLYNFIPCRFPITVDNPFDAEIQLSQIQNGIKGLNLFQTKTNKPIIPDEISTDKKIKMSDWEIRNFGVKYMIRFLQSKQCTVMSAQDTLQSDPQIWFKDSEGHLCWLLIRSSIGDKKIKKPRNIKNLIKQGAQNDGYFVGLSVIPVNNTKKIYRGDDISIKLSEFEQLNSENGSADITKAEDNFQQ